MPDPAASTAHLPPLDPQIGLTCVVADYLIPLFMVGAIDVPLARRMAHSAMDAYYPETRADYVNVARTIAFSMAALALLGKAMSQDMALPEQMRAFGRANALNRSADQSELSMMRRRRYQQDNPSPEPPAMEPVPLEPDPQFDDAEMEAQVVEAMKAYHAACASHKAEAEAAPAAAATGMPQPSGVDTPLHPPVSIPASAIRASIPRFDAGPPRTATRKEELLRNSTLQRVVGESVAQHPI
jgi:hypothetical protein